MNTIRNSLKLLALGACFTLALAAVPSAKAGPGIDYWLNLGKPKAENSAPVAVPARRNCPDSKIVSVGEMQSVLRNGRGAQRYVQTGTKRVCESCAPATTVMKPTWPNGKGPLAPVSVKSTHNCDSSCILGS